MATRLKVFNIGTRRRCKTTLEQQAKGALNKNNHEIYDGTVQNLEDAKTAIDNGQYTSAKALCDVCIEFITMYKGLYDGPYDPNN